MVIGQDNCVEIECLEAISKHLPTPGDLRLRVNVQSDGFAGQSSSAWIDRNEFERFLDQLRKLDTKRQGCAELVALSPEDFKLRIWPTIELDVLPWKGRSAQA